MYLSFNIIVFCAFHLNILMMANCEFSSINGASIFINFCSFGFKTICSLGKKSIDLFKKLKHDSHKFIRPSNSKYILNGKKNKIYVLMYFCHQCKHFESMTMYIYHYWYDEQYANELSISYLNPLHFRCKFWYVHHK